MSKLKKHVNPKKSSAAADTFGKRGEAPLSGEDLEKGKKKMSKYLDKASS